MAQLGNYDHNAAPSETRETLPPGDYMVQIVKSDFKTTKNGSGQYLEIELDIIDGACAGRKLWDRLNLVNANTTAQEIANRTLASIRHATNVPNPTDSEELHHKPMIATVKVRPAGPDKSGMMRDAQNEVGGYKAPTGAKATASASAPTMGGVPKPAGTVPPWRTKSA